ncbi:hypothetical protein COW57_03935 [Candidatus Roizmanbacteria bacterium CG17_big_fil_post_rev_8_21_14_2_50_39_7]|uniref:Uncharacterized protein n=1 Tax=Candidatus Roizmanbacteria bacterium CG17_big_fil_post_rev_8_21_14_2_50_39_7 TaxID=1974858 RepID=A0A2M7EJF7_9BACT|nr:MAG: hypothetical protein COW57_03935 [Candidatus Roizmanbacteria bacterium CG17_big_fil_post_rev_8_21_14_2_50_39_7]
MSDRLDEPRFTEDTGIWKVMTKGYEGRVVIESNDFSFDAQMLITGDFVDYKERIEYAQKICDRLNATIPDSS